MMSIDTEEESELPISMPLGQLNLQQENQNRERI